jgi:hypothetical protein
MKVKKRSLVVIEWVDAVTCHGWENEDKVQSEFNHNLSVGWKLKSDRRHFRLTPMRDGEGRCTDIQVIPRSNVTSIRKIE